MYVATLFTNIYACTRAVQNIFACTQTIHKITTCNRIMRKSICMKSRCVQRYLHYTLYVKYICMYSRCV